MNEISNEVLVERLDRWREAQDISFNGIHRRFDENKEEHLGIMRRQDHTNGTVTEHEKKIISVEAQYTETMAYLKGMLRVFVFVAVVTPCIVGSLFSLYIYYLRSEITKEIHLSIEENNNKQFEIYNK